MLNRIRASKKTPRSAPLSPEQGNSPESSPRVLGSTSSPRRPSLFQLASGRTRRSNSVGNRLSLNNSPRTAASLEYLWLLRPETRELVDKAVEMVDKDQSGVSSRPPLDSFKTFLDRCLFSNRVQEQERVRELSYISPLWGGSRRVFEYVLENLKRIGDDDRRVLGPIVMSSILAWLEYDSFPSLNEYNVELMSEICAVLPDGESWRTRVLAAAEHAAKNFRSAPIIFPSLAPPETVRLQFVDLLDLDRRELAQEIVHMTWRIFCSIRAVEWASFLHYSRPSNNDESPEGCENILSLIQFTKSMQQWIRTSLALRSDKAKVLVYWLATGESVLNANCHHMALAILEAIEGSIGGERPVIFGFPAGFPPSAVSALNKFKSNIASMLPGKLLPYLQHAVASTTSTDRPPHLMPLRLLLDSFTSIIARAESDEGEALDALRCPLDVLVGVVQSVMYMQQGIRHYGLSQQALSHDMHDLLQEMPLMPESFLEYAAKVPQRGRSEPEYSDDTWSSDASHRKSSDLDFGSNTTPPKGSPSVLTPRTPSPVHGSPVNTPRRGTGSLRSTGGSGNERSDLGLSIASRVMSQRGASSAAAGKHTGETHMFLVSESGKIRFEEDDQDGGASEEPDVIKFSLTDGSLRVIWVRGKKWLARVLTGTTPLGFSLHVVDDILFGWRLIFTKPSQLFCMLIDEYPEVPPDQPIEHLLPDRIFSLESVRAVRKRVLYVIKRLVDIERSCASVLADDKDLMESWHTFYWRLKTGNLGLPPGSSPGSSSPRTSSPRKSSSPRVSQNRFSTISRGSGGNLQRQQSLQILNHCMDEFVCASTIDWSLRNSKVRSMVPTAPPPTDYDLLSMNETYLAETLTVVEQNAFCGIGVGELLGFHSAQLPAEAAARMAEENSEGKDVGFNWLRWTVERFNATCSWVGSTIVLEDDAHRRAELILYFMRLVMAALQLGNVSLAYSVFAGLESLPVIRLKKTWAEVATLDPKRNTTGAFESLKETFSPESGHFQLRVHHLNNLNKIRVPFTGLWTKDVFLIDRNNQTYIEKAEPSPRPEADVSSSKKLRQSREENNEGGIVAPTHPMHPNDVVNVEKLSMIADSVCRVIFFQGNESLGASRGAFSPTVIIDPIAHGVKLSEEDALYKASLRREPKTQEVQNPLMRP